VDDLYLLAVIAKHRVEEHPDAAPYRVRARLMPLLGRWGGSRLEEVTVSGSHAKGTAIRGASLWPDDVDVDLLASLAAETPEPLADSQRRLAGVLREYQAEVANVTVRLLVDNRRVDVTVGRRWPGGEGHTLWQARKGTWLRTNVAEQIRYVRESGRVEEIQALKIWRRRQGVYFPSFCLELAVIEALKGAGKGKGIGERFLRVLDWLAAGLPETALWDPANASNAVSETMAAHEKWSVANAAWMSLKAEDWGDVVNLQVHHGGRV
jgi:hypothetical protein